MINWFSHQQKQNKGVHAQWKSFTRLEEKIVGNTPYFPAKSQKKKGKVFKEDKKTTTSKESED